MNGLWGDKIFWQRVGVVAAVVWVGGIAIISAIARDFYWFHDSYYRNPIGPAAITAGVGLAIIGAIAVGIPWIADAANKRGG
jgi:hypothetical protein